MALDENMSNLYVLFVNQVGMVKCVTPLIVPISRVITMEPKYVIPTDSYVTAHN